MKNTLLALAMAMFLVVALAAPAIAQMTHTVAYEMDGTINFEKQAGHKCNTGAEIKQTIVGNGVMDKVQTVSMIPGRISMEDDNNWVAGATPLTVTTVWDLCAPGKYVYDDDETDVIPLDVIYGGTIPAGASPISDQIWAVQVQADPGFSGNLYQNGVAAYGPYQSNGNNDITIDYEATADDWNRFGSDTWTFGQNRYNQDVPMVGPDFVGNYFTMEQDARTSQGTQRRYISLSSPFSHAYLMEDMSVVGRSDISDALEMNNLPAGGDVPGLWWNLF